MPLFSSMYDTYKSMNESGSSYENYIAKQEHRVGQGIKVRFFMDVLILRGIRLHLQRELVRVLEMLLLNWDHDWDLLTCPVLDSKQERDCPLP